MIKPETLGDDPTPYAAGGEFVIDADGKPVARVVPMPAPEPLFGALAGSVHAEGDIVAPLGVEWTAER